MSLTKPRPRCGRNGLSTAPDVIETEARRYPSLERITACLAGTVEIEILPIPLDCVGGFAEAYFGRPHQRRRLITPAEG